MNCRDFEEQISDYLDQGMSRQERREFCEHLLACPECRELFGDIREGLDLCRGGLGWAGQSSSGTGTVEYLPPSPCALGAVGQEGLEGRIVSGATIGEMVSCRTLDHLISDYFEGDGDGRMDEVIAGHVAICEDCSRLMNGLRAAIDSTGDDLAATELRTALNDRILAATAGNGR